MKAWMLEAQKILSIDSKKELYGTIDNSDNLIAIGVGRRSECVPEYDSEQHLGTFHTHTYGDTTFGKHDIKDYLDSDEVIMAVGINGEVRYVDRTKFPKKIQHVIKIYSQSKRSYKQNYIDFLYEWFNNYYEVV